MDPRMAAEVQKRVMGKPEQKKLEMIIGDFVKADLPYFDVCISNTPYQVSGAGTLEASSLRLVHRSPPHSSSNSSHTGLSFVPLFSCFNASSPYASSLLPAPRCGADSLPTFNYTHAWSTS